MTVAASRLLSAALDLPDQERIELASQLLASVEGPGDEGWSEAWLAELDRRAAVKTDPGTPKTSWEVARSRLLERLPRR